MVAKIATPQRVQDALNYNEQKLRKGKAELLVAAGYLASPEKLNFYQKLAGLENRNSLNDRAQTKTLHISLNFDPSERLSNDVLQRIAEDYMNRIGFAQQPLLVYRHYDAGHPHLHIVTTTIKEDGSRINTHNLGKNASETARKAIEEEYGLVRAQKNGKQQANKTIPAAAAICYGKDETKRSISSVVSSVMKTYVFGSLPEFNAALRQFNVAADRGKEGSRTFQHNGLVYRILDQNGEKVGVPIKASTITSKPTLQNLEKLFEQNNTKKESMKHPLREAIDRELAVPNTSWQDFVNRLQTKGIIIIERKTAEGRIYGVTFVDNRSQCVVNGSDLGKGYSAASILGRLHLSPTIKPVNSLEDERAAHTNKQTKTHHPIQIQEKEKTRTLTDSITLINQLLSPINTLENVSPELIRKKRKRKNRNNRL